MLNDRANPQAQDPSQLQCAPPVTTETSPPRRDRKGSFAKHSLFAAKLIISAACLWLVFRRINPVQSLSDLPTLDYRWAVLAVFVAVIQIPLLAGRLLSIVRAIGHPSARPTYFDANIVTAIYGFFAQVVPGFVGEGLRAWLLVRYRCSWREALTSVVIDRGVGVALLVAFSFVILQLPSPLAAALPHRDLFVFGFGGALVTGVLTLILGPRAGFLLRRWRYLFWIATLIDDAHRVLLGRSAPKILAAGCLVHMLSIVVVCAVGCALGLSLSAFDCAVLFVVMVGVVVVPISVGGWGLRELAVVSLLEAHGLAPEQALLFSLCFGFVFVAVGLLGAVVWMFYPLPTNDAAWSTAA